ncbi:MAG TPA: sugar ABC transporter ATP-binding protein [Steroidobacteraceae bacterium]|nr:sugar ABC transporter ATP-binding protein [Steroidobacteraceae bacterium]
MEAAAADPLKPGLLEVSRVSKSYPGVAALEDVTLRLEHGTVHALLGENGAGKSTLMRIVAGVCTPDAGELRLEGRTLRLGSPGQALAAGIAMIHQELNLLPAMSVAENIWIRREPVNALGLVRHRELRRRTRALLERLGVELDPQAELGTLPLAARQMVEIARALSYDSRVLIMDEPTSALTERDAERLFAVIRDLRARGVGIFYVTHRIEELFALADRISVLRDGRHVGSASPRDLSRSDIIRMMVGRELSAPPAAAAPAPAGPVALSAHGLTLGGGFYDVSFELHAGEVLGVAGLVGSGRSKLAAALFGLVRPTAGEIRIAGSAARIDSPAAAISRGIGFVTEDRKESGCFQGLSVLENLEISALARDFVRLGFVHAGAARRACAGMASALKVKAPDLRERIETLSGGNQQKVLLGRWLLLAPQILILDEPTRGVDVGAKAEIHQLIARLVAEGAAVLMISSEMPEILAMSHRIMVMREGRVAGILARDVATPAAIMDLAAR